jgi:tetratricopeptide (TPR) repeat protein
VGLRNFFEGKEIKELRSQVESNQCDPAAHFNLGIAYEKAGRKKEAIQEFENTLKTHSSSAEAHYNLAILYESMKMGEKAILHIIKAGNFFGNKNDQVNKLEARRLLREYYRKFDVKPEDFPLSD